MKKTIAIHKFSSCDGCQLAFLNAGSKLLILTELVDIMHFAEAGYINPNAKVDIAFVEGSISTPAEIERIQTVRANSHYLITIGACATSGGIQALRNGQNIAEWMQSIYAKPKYIETLATSTAIAEHVKVDLELWGCPVTTRQIMYAIRQLLFDVVPEEEEDSICLTCKRAGHVCVLVTQQKPCMGPVTRTGCGAICPRIGRDCYGCFGPAETVNSDAFGERLQSFGLTSKTIVQRFKLINNHAAKFKAAANTYNNEDR